MRNILEKIKKLINEEEKENKKYLSEDKNNDISLVNIRNSYISNIIKEYLQDTTKKYIELNFNRYINLEKKIFQHKKRSLLISPTGSGKTYSTLYTLDKITKSLNDNEYIVFTVPNTLNVEQIEKEYGNYIDIQCIYGKTERNKYGGKFNNAPNAPKLIVTTIDSIRKLKIKTKNSKDETIEQYINIKILVNDEIHMHITEYDYRRDAIDELKNVEEIVISNRGSIIDITATANILNFEQYSYVYNGIQEEIYKKDNTKLNIKLIKSEKQMPHYISEDIENDYNNGSFYNNKYVVLKNDKKINELLYNVVSDKLVENNIDGRVCNIYSDIKDTSEAYIEIVEQSRLTYNITISTFLLDSGVNINNGENIKLYILNEVDTSKIKQIIARFRTAATIEVILLYSYSKRKPRKAYNYNREVKLYRNRYIEIEELCRKANERIYMSNYYNIMNNTGMVNVNGFPVYKNAYFEYYMFSRFYLNHNIDVIIERLREYFEDKNINIERNPIDMNLKKDEDGNRTRRRKVEQLAAARFISDIKYKFEEDELIQSMKIREASNEPSSLKKSSIILKCYSPSKYTRLKNYWILSGSKNKESLEGKLFKYIKEISSSYLLIEQIKSKNNEAITEKEMKRLLNQYNTSAKKQKKRKKKGIILQSKFNAEVNKIIKSIAGFDINDFDISNIYKINNYKINRLRIKNKLFNIQEIILYNENNIIKDINSSSIFKGNKLKADKQFFEYCKEYVLQNERLIA